MVFKEYITSCLHFFHVMINFHVWYRTVVGDSLELDSMIGALQNNLVKTTQKRGIQNLANQFSGHPLGGFPDHFRGHPLRNLMY